MADDTKASESEVKRYEGSDGDYLTRELEAAKQDIERAMANHVADLNALESQLRQAREALKNGNPLRVSPELNYGEQPAPASRDEGVSDERLAELINECAPYCMKLKYGECTTLACLERDAYGRAVLPVKLLGCEVLHTDSALRELQHLRERVRTLEADARRLPVREFKGTDDPDTTDWTYPVEFLDAVKSAMPADDFAPSLEGIELALIGYERVIGRGIELPALSAEAAPKCATCGGKGYVACVRTNCECEGLGADPCPDCEKGSP